jgi:hypothetical protein
MLDLLGHGVSVIVATRDATLRPQIARGWGPEALSPHGPLRLCVETRAGSRTLENLVCGTRIAVTFTRPSTYRSIQAKGIVAAIDAPTEGQLHRVDDHWEAYAVEAERFGLSERLVTRILDREWLLAVTVTLEDIYDQTPGPRAGVRL